MRKRAGLLTHQIMTYKPVIITEDLDKKRLKELKDKGKKNNKGVDKFTKQEVDELLNLILEKLGIEQKI